MYRKIKELLPNPFVVDYQHSNAPLDLYTEAEMLKFARSIISEFAMLTLDHKSDDYYNGWLDFRDKVVAHFVIGLVDNE
jgi:hypothetical protein